MKSMRLFQHKHLRKAQKEKNTSTFKRELMSPHIEGVGKKKEYFRRFENEHQLSCVLGEMGLLWKNHDQIVIHAYICVHIYTLTHIHI